jgi:hypothetical protein
MPRPLHVPRGADARPICPFCGHGYADAPNTCPRCGTLLGDAVDDLKREGARARRLLRTRKALADLFFLIGLLLGGPMMTLGGQFQWGLFIVLAGATASVLRRYTDWSTPGTVLVGALVATVLATWVVEPARAEVAGMKTGEQARTAYAQALASRDPDVMVDARGPGSVTVWYTLSQATAGPCGSYPGAEERRHLAQLGFVRVVVSARNSSGGVCSFRP